MACGEFRCPAAPRGAAASKGTRARPDRRPSRGVWRSPSCRARRPRFARERARGRRRLRSCTRFASGWQASVLLETRRKKNGRAATDHFFLNSPNGHRPRDRVSPPFVRGAVFLRCAGVRLVLLDPRFQAILAAVRSMLDHLYELPDRGAARLCGWSSHVRMQLLGVNTCCSRGTSN